MPIMRRQFKGSWFLLLTARLQVASPVVAITHQRDRTILLCGSLGWSLVALLL